MPIGKGSRNRGKQARILRKQQTRASREQRPSERDSSAPSVEALKLIFLHVFSGEKTVPELLQMQEQRRKKILGSLASLRKSRASDVLLNRDRKALKELELALLDLKRLDRVPPDEIMAFFVKNFPRIVEYEFNFLRDWEKTAQVSMRNIPFKLGLVFATFGLKPDSLVIEEFVAQERKRLDYLKNLSAFAREFKATRLPAKLRDFLHQEIVAHTTFLQRLANLSSISMEGRKRLAAYARKSLIV